MKRFIMLFFLCPVFIVHPQSYSSLTLSEVMFNPESGENEFIEIYNTSIKDSIDIKDLKIKYAASNADIIGDSISNTVLPPLSFAVIFEGDYDLQNGIYKTLVPPGTIVLKISDNSFGTSGMANTSDRQILLLDPLNDTIEVYNYSADNDRGHSDEKVILNNDNSASNWANSIIYNGTPGFKNSVTPFTYDLKLSRIYIFPSIPVIGDNESISALIKNTGIKTANNFSIEFYNDINNDSIATPGELFKEELFNELKPGDSISVNAILNTVQLDTYRIIVKINYPFDENNSDNVSYFNFKVLPPAANYNDIVVNEIMYSPSQDEPEWVELFNQSDNAINICGWRIYDKSRSALITEEDMQINPGSFFIIARDSSIKEYYSFDAPFVAVNMPSLNNSGDAVVIRDSLNYTIDSLLYLPSWGGSNGKSLERINSKIGSNLPDNWGTSESRFNATPGEINSITPKENNLKISFFKSLDKYGIIGNEIKFLIQIRNIGLAQANNFSVKLFRDSNFDSTAQSNELLITLNVNSLLSNDSVQLNLSTKIFTPGINQFIAIVDYTLDDDTTNNISFLSLKCVETNEERSDIVINEIMFAPENNEPEWIELFNRSSKTINLNGYMIADAKDTMKIANHNVFLNTGDYLVISTDSIISNFYNISSNLLVSKFPSLNNGGDKIILIDSLYRTIDSLEFYSSWGGNKGKSLERIDNSSSSTDSLNWKTSTSKYNATPGYINSVSPKEYDVELTNLTFSPPHPFFNDNVSIHAKVKNNGTKSSAYSIRLFEDRNKDSIPDNLVKELSNLYLQPHDSVELDLQYTIEKISSEKSYYAEILSLNDQDTSNNYFYQNISPGYFPGTILINEIMYNPVNGEPEWIELFNNTEDSVYINNWSLTDVVSTPVKISINTNIKIPPKGYIIIARDTTIINYHRIIPSPVIKVSLPVLNNDYDGAILKDERGITIDSVLYNKDLGGENGFSLERKSISTPSDIAGNWGSSKDIELSTPGRINSITDKKFDLAADKIYFSPRFPVSGETVFIQLLIKNLGTSGAENFSVEFYIDSDSNNTADKLIDVQSNLSLIAGDSVLIKSSQSVEVFTSKLLAAAKIIFNTDENIYNNYSEGLLEPGYSAGSVKINEVMFSPLNGMPEWIEFVNVSDGKINLKDWMVSDILPVPTKGFITNSELIIDPGEYFIITKDTSFFNEYPDVNSKINIVNFGTLGNTEDGVIIYDFRNAIIDSLSYNSSWGGKNGFSLERFSFSALTSDSSNWATSLSSGHSTPGEINSILNVPSYNRNDVVFNELMFEPGTGNNEFIEFYNLSERTINLGGWKFVDETGNLTKLSDTSLFLPPKNYFVLAADSSVLYFYKLFDYPYLTVLNISNLGLNNSEESLVLKDLRGNVIDSLRYFSKWHNKNFESVQNISIERINPFLSANDPSNWSSSVNSLGATPGRQNSIYADIQKSESKLSVLPNPFSPDNDGFEDFTIISYNITQATSQIRIKIYDSRGRLVRNLVNNRPSGSNGSIIFNGLDNNGRALRMGIYIIYLEALNQTSAVLETMKTVVVVARKLH